MSQAGISFWQPLKWTNRYEGPNPGQHRGVDIGYMGGRGLIYSLNGGRVVAIVRHAQVGWYMVIDTEKVGSAARYESHCHLYGMLYGLGDWVPELSPIARAATWGDFTGSAWNGPHDHFTCTNAPSPLTGARATNPETIILNTLSSASGGGITPIPPTPPEDTLSAAEVNQINAHATAQANRVIDALRREGRGRLFFDGGQFGETTNIASAVGGRAAIGLPGHVSILPTDPEMRAAVVGDITTGKRSLIMAFNEVAQPLPTTEFYRTIDWFNDPTTAATFGTFKENLFEITGSGSTRQVRTRGAGVIEAAYGNRTQVWADGRPVRLTYKGETVTAYLSGGRVRTATGVFALSPAEVDRANAQRVDGQTWA